VIEGGDGEDTIHVGAGRDRASGGPEADVFAISTEAKAGATGGDTTSASVAPVAPTTPATTAPASSPVLGSLRPPSAEFATLIGDVLTIQKASGADSITLTMTGGQLALADGTPIATATGTVGSVAASGVRQVVVLGDDTPNGGAGTDTIDGGSGRDNDFDA